MSIDVEYAIKKDIRNNPVVREIDRQQKRDFIRMISLVALIVGMLLFSAWQHFRIVFNGYEIERLRQELSAAEATNRKLKLEIETWRRPDLVESRASRELHMVQPSAKDTLVIERARAVSPAKAIVATAR
jgi:cell division protein FtsL